MMRTVTLPLAGLLSLLAGAALAQPMDHMAMPGMSMAPAPASQPPAPIKPLPEAMPHHDMGAMDGMPGMDHGAMDHGSTDRTMAGMDGHGMAGHGHGNLAAYPMTRDATGTAWQPDSAKHDGLHGTFGGWTTMLHASATLVYDDQGGPRGEDKTFVESMFLAQAQRPLGDGSLTLRAHGSLDPTMGKGGYPLLFQTGETANGVTRLIDRQHPHDLVDELSVTISQPIGAGSAFAYVAYPGEPALGPVTYLHRGSGMISPETPIDHHWLDSTHVSFGVATAGYVWGAWKIEGSVFTGREPDQHRWDFDRPRFDSGSVRLTFNPTKDWSLQVSQGWLTSPEQLEPDVDQRRTTASATWNRTYEGGNWQTTLAWGRNVLKPGRTLDAFLLESAASVGPHTVFARAEQAQKDELFDAPSPLAGTAYRVGKLSVGYAYTLKLKGPFAVDFGGLVSGYSFPGALDAAYGRHPVSVMLFTRVNLR